jgi:hypothetical protein
MKPFLVILTVVGVVVAAVAVSSRLLTMPASSAIVRRQSGFLLLPPAASAGQMVLYGHVKKLTAKSGHFELRFDPAWFTSGVTANVAQAQDQGTSCQPTACPPVPNDNYVIEEGHRLLTYLVPTSAHVTVLTNAGTKGISATPISVAELSRIVNGGPHRKLFEPLESGVWLRVRIDTVRELDQQYRP